MSLLRPAVRVLQHLTTFQQYAPISTTAACLKDCAKPKKGAQKCDPIKGVGCKPRARPSCKAVPRERMVCVRLEVPDPSYAECLKDPKPPKGMSECPKTDSGPPKECLPERLGISIDGCQPPTPPTLGACKPRISSREVKEDQCPRGPCDPDIKPFKKQAGPMTASPISCPSTSHKPSICEPKAASSAFSSPMRMFSSDCQKTKKPKKPCFEPKKVKPTKEQLEDWSSPVSCTAKGMKGNLCDQRKCGPSFTPCDKPPGIHNYRCPKRIKKPRMMASTVVVKERKIRLGYKICKEPKGINTFSCKPKVAKRQVVVKGPPTPTRCPCFSPVDLNRVEGPYCAKMKPSVEPDCNKKGGKPKAICDKERCKNAM